MADEKTIYKMKTPSGDPVRVEEAWKDANGELLTEKVNKADAQTITGLKTFSTLPQSSATPSDDKDLATKKYSDDLWATRKAQEEKCYQALKTVTKDFTRTDPVYVRIGEDGKPEIHYTCTNADYGSYFRNFTNLSSTTVYFCNAVKVTSFWSAFAWSFRRIFFDDTSNVTNWKGAFNYSYIVEIGSFDMSGASSDGFANAFDAAAKLEKFGGYGAKASFDLHSTALKHDAILEVFNNLGTVDKTAGITLTLGSAKLALMSDEEKAIATGKGWVLA